MTSLNDSAMRNMPGTAPLLLLSGQPVSFLKVLRRLPQMGVGVLMLTCRVQTHTAYSHCVAPTIACRPC
jgi:hypothetical protein